MGATAYLALLRGVNVGGKNKLPMKALARTFAEAGCEHVRTFIQSGNVLFEKGGGVADLPAAVSRRIAEEFGLRVPVQLRTADQLRRVVADNPYPAAGVPGELLHVAFLAEAPDPARVATLDPDRSPPDAFVVRGGVVYLHLPNGAGRSRLTGAYFDSRLATVSTIRNWRTVTRLLALLGG